MLQGESVDLNQVLSTMHFINLDEERKGHMGTTEVVFVVTESKQHVRLELNGLLPSEECPRRSYSSSLTKETSCLSMPTILRGCSPPNTLAPTRKSFSMTSQLETRLEGDRPSCSPISTTSIASAKQSPMQTELSIRAMGVKGRPKEGTNLGKEKDPRRIYATVSMERQDVISSRTSAITSISAEGVGKEDMVSICAQKSSKETVHGMRPKYLHHNIWDPDSDFSPNTAD